MPQEREALNKQVFQATNSQIHRKTSQTIAEGIQGPDTPQEREALNKQAFQATNSQIHRKTSQTKSTLTTSKVSKQDHADEENLQEIETFQGTNLTKEYNVNLNASQHLEKIPETRSTLNKVSNKIQDQ